MLLATGGWGWHAKAGLHALRMVVTGVFERHPSLRLILGHAGEMLPSLLARIDDGATQSVNQTRPYTPLRSDNAALIVIDHQVKFMSSVVPSTLAAERAGAPDSGGSPAIAVS